MSDTIVCPGLDGADPLGALAALGLFSVGSRAGALDRMGWCWDGGWRPRYEGSVDRSGLIEVVIESFVGRAAAHARNALEDAQREAARTGRRPSRADEAAVDRLAAEGVRARHPITGLAAHLDDQTPAEKKSRKGRPPADPGPPALSGLTRAQFVALAAAPDAQPYLAGLACDAPMADRKKPIIARTHLSFANKGSNKMLVKDFLGVACRITVARVEDALFGAGVLRDAITGLGWDPASQRSYALQFRDPQEEVSCQVVHHALALAGLAFFPVVPLRRDRATVGLYSVDGAGAVGGGGSEEGDEDAGEDEAAEARGRAAEYFTWPLWEMPLPMDTVRALVARREFAEPRPAVEDCHRLGVASLMRSRRFSLDKRSYFAPARPVV